MSVTDLLQVMPPPIVDGSHGMMQVIELPPGDAGVGAHRHSGPVFGYVIEGEILFELEGDAPYVLKAGDAFFEPGGDVIHYQAANLSSESRSRFFVAMLCAPDVPMITMVDDDEIAARRDRRHPAAPAAR
ncbi:cupin domain-containing protein [Kribbella antibiotica]|uniref:Cupin domain-containing protein n=2 Tax=Kribbella antibiotica TaxID=190195 RepID=A0A4R4Z6J6_9ACTN|nr:cupin domain-containing protein [Kribbella antibiotica]